MHMHACALVCVCVGGGGVNGARVRGWVGAWVCG